MYTGVMFSISATVLILYLSRNTPMCYYQPFLLLQQRTNPNTNIHNTKGSFNELFMHYLYNRNCNYTVICIQHIKDMGFECQSVPLPTELIKPTKALNSLYTIKSKSRKHWYEAHSVSSLGLEVLG